jgi:hypothetical protein
VNRKPFRMLAFLCFWFTTSLSAAPSAIRPKGVDYKETAASHRPRLTPFTRRIPIVPETAYDGAVQWKDLDIQAAPEELNLSALFEYVRDTRELISSADVHFFRRIPWLYPHDGCWIRASIASQWAEREGYARPMKLFIFGNLEVTTANAVGGSVGWWYHVVPAVKDGNGNLMVIDPAIEPDKPMQAVDWITAMLPKVDDAQLNLCSTFTYEPYDDCALAASGDEQNAVIDVEWYLNKEWANIKYLGREPKKELADNPPWKP